MELIKRNTKSAPWGHFLRTSANVNVRPNLYHCSHPLSFFRRLIIWLKIQEDFNSQLASAGQLLVVVDFHATWCGPCKFIAPKLEEFAKTYAAKIVVLKVSSQSDNNTLLTIITTHSHLYSHYKGRCGRVRRSGRHVQCGQHADIHFHQGLETGGIVFGRKCRETGGDHQEVGLNSLFVLFCNSNWGKTAWYTANSHKQQNRNTTHIIVPLYTKQTHAHCCIG